MHKLHTKRSSGAKLFAHFKEEILAMAFIVRREKGWKT